MYSYMPPKPSMWGHSLRKLAPATEKALFTEFLTRAVAEYSLSDGSLTLFSGLPRGTIFNGILGGNGIVQRFEHLLGATTQNGHFAPLSPQQIEKCLNEIIIDSTLIPRLILVQPVAVSKWSIEGRAVATDSRFLLYYGIKPCISTFLRFDDLDQFQYIKQAFEDLGFCTLNKIHLKVVREPRTARPENQDSVD